MRTKAKKGSTDLSDLSLNRWLDDESGKLEKTLEIFLTLNMPRKA